MRVIDVPVFFLSLLVLCYVFIDTLMLDSFGAS
jgi:hypothetical protein